MAADTKRIGMKAVEIRRDGTDVVFEYPNGAQFAASSKFLIESVEARTLMNMVKIMQMPFSRRLRMAWKVIRGL